MDEIDISNPGALQGGGATHPWRVLGLIMAQAVANASSAVAFRQTREGITLRYEAGGSWHEMIPPPPEITEPMLRMLKETAGIPVDAGWGEGEIPFRTEKGPMRFRVAVCSDLAGRGIVLMTREPGDPSLDEPGTKTEFGERTSEGDPMFERFTDRTRMAMALADREAHRLCHRHVGTEHLLLGLMEEDRAGAALVLKTLGADLETLRREVQKLVPSETDKIALGDLPPTARARQALKYACEEARALGQNYVGTEHLLLGLMQDPECTAARVVTNLGLNLDTIREKVRALHEKGDKDTGCPPDAGGGNASFRCFTDRARKVMALANQEAQRFNHESIGTEHILLGLVKEGGGVGATTLKKLGVDLKGVRAEVEKLVKGGPARVVAGKLPQTPRAKTVIEFAIQEAQDLGHNYVGTEHMLLGLLRESDGIGAQVLLNLGLKLEDVRREVLALLGAGTDRDLGVPFQRTGVPSDGVRPAGGPPPESASAMSEQAGLGRVEDLAVWQKADKLAQRIYLLTSTFPKEEVPGVASRLREVALTIPPYIAEAYSRPTRKESRWLLNTAFGSLRELRYLLSLSVRLGYLTPGDHQPFENLAEEVDKLLRALYSSLKR